MPLPLICPKAPCSWQPGSLLAWGGMATCPWQAGQALPAGPWLPCQWDTLLDGDGGGIRDAFKLP